MPVFSSGELSPKPPKLDSDAPCYCRARAGVQSCTANHLTGIRVQRRHPTRQQALRNQTGAQALTPRRRYGSSEGSRLFGHPCFGTRCGGVSAGKETQG